MRPLERRIGMRYDFFHGMSPEMVLSTCSIAANLLSGFSVDTDVVAPDLVYIV